MIQRIVVLSNRRVIDAQAVVEAIGMGKEPCEARTNKVAVLEPNLRRGELLKALKESGGSKRIAARGLGISEATLYRWIQEFGLSQELRRSGQRVLQ